MGLAKLTNPAPLGEISYYNLRPGQLAVITAWEPNSEYRGRIIQALPEHFHPGAFALVLGSNSTLGMVGKATDTEAHSRVRILKDGEQITV